MTDNSSAKVVDQIVDLYQRRGCDRYDESVTQLEHAVQCAVLAADEGASPALVAAALLHDIGHLLGAERRVDGERIDTDFRHEAEAGRWLRAHFDDGVVVPVVLHVRAKRYLCAVDPGYRANLSAGSVRSLELQGGPLAPNEVQAFEAVTGWREATLLRGWDDRAKVVGAPMEQFDEYRHLLGSLARH